MAHGSGNRLIMIYNADGGLFSMISDAVHKVVSPETYPCSLCAITYGPVSMRRNWRSFLEGLGLSLVFLHRDELDAAIAALAPELPCIVLDRQGSGPAVLVEAAMLNQIERLDDLIQTVRERLDQHQITPSSG